MNADTPVLHHIDHHEAGEVHHVTVNNPHKLNVLGSATMDALRERLEDIGGQDRARLVLLHGAGNRAWIGGADINEMATLDERSAATFIRRLHQVCRTLREHPLPVIAVLRGWCLGAGLEVAACCDLRLSDTNAHFGMPEVRVGLASVIEAAVLPRLIGIGHARDLVMTGRVVSASEIDAWGFLDGLTAPEALDALVQTRTGEILAGGPRAMRAQKALCRAWEEQPLTQAIETGITTFSDSFRSDEPHEYLQRFLNRARSTGKGTSS